MSSLPPPSDPFFLPSTTIPASHVNGWRVERVAPGLVRLTMFEILDLVEESPDGPKTTRSIKPLFAALTTEESLRSFHSFLSTSFISWKELDQGGSARPPKSMVN